MEQLQQMELGGYTFSLNLLLIVMALLLFYHVVNGYRVGMVKEIISFISLIFLCVLIALLGNALTSYVHKAYLELAVMIFLLAVMGLVHHLIKVIVFPAEILSRLPIVHSVDKILGLVIGALEPVLILWTIYALIRLFDLGQFENYIVLCINDSDILMWFYENNRLVPLVEQFGAQFQDTLSTYISL